MPTLYETGDALKARKIIVKAERIDVDRQRIRLTHEHTGQRAVARGEAIAYIDLPLESVPKSGRS